MGNPLAVDETLQHASTNTKRAAAYLGLSEKTLANMRCRGDGPKFVKMGRVRYRWADLAEYVEERVRTSTSDRGLVQTNATKRGA